MKRVLNVLVMTGLLLGIAAVADAQEEPGERRRRGPDRGRRLEDLSPEERERIRERRKAVEERLKELSPERRKAALERLGKDRAGRAKEGPGERGPRRARRGGVPPAFEQWLERMPEERRKQVIRRLESATPEERQRFMQRFSGARRSDEDRRRTGRRGERRERGQAPRMRQRPERGPAPGMRQRSGRTGERARGRMGEGRRDRPFLREMIRRRMEERGRGRAPRMHERQRRGRAPRMMERRGRGPAPRMQDRRGGGRSPWIEERRGHGPRGPMKGRRGMGRDRPDRPIRDRAPCPHCGR
ncbi:MAG: hypothetical protein ACYS99_08975 [Planctomycetota bacterium]|jgi:hypothetical protein